MFSRSGMSSMNLERIALARSGYERFRRKARSTFGKLSGTYNPPSGARPSRRISLKRRAGELPRVETYCIRKRTLKKFFEPDSRDAPHDGGKLLDLGDRAIDVLLEREVREQDDVDTALALFRLLLHHGVDRDP